MNTTQDSYNRIKVIRGDFISVTDVQAWGCFITQDMSWEGALNQRILEEAGEAFDAHVLDHVVQPKVGAVYCLPAFGAPVDKILLGILPQWRDGLFDEEQLLVRCYRNLMKSLEEHEIDSIALPALGAGQRSFPQRRVARMTMNILFQNMPETLDELSIVCRDEKSFEVYLEKIRPLRKTQT